MSNTEYRPPADHDCNVSFSGFCPVCMARMGASLEPHVIGSISSLTGTASIGSTPFRYSEALSICRKANVDHAVMEHFPVPVSAVAAFRSRYGLEPRGEDADRACEMLLGEVVSFMEGDPNA